MTFLGMSDLVARWVYTPQGARKLARQSDFPAPVFTLNAGRVKVWSLDEIEAFEKSHPEVKSQAAKRNKVIGYRRAVAKGFPTAAPEGEAHNGNQS